MLEIGDGAETDSSENIVGFFCGTHCFEHFFVGGMVAGGSYQGGKCSAGTGAVDYDTFGVAGHFAVE